MQMLPTTVSSNLRLIPLSGADQPKLFKLMKRIYPPAYGHYWKDDCSWYLESQYGVANFERELETLGGGYYFVVLNEVRAHFGESQPKTIGILKIISDYVYPPYPEVKALKIHRIYLDPAVQGKGIGKRLMQHVHAYALATAYQIVWLDAMDTCTQAQAFYSSLGYERTAQQLLKYKLLHDEHRAMWYLHKWLE